MSDKMLVEVTEAELKALNTAIALMKAKASTFGDTGSDFAEDLLPLKALRKRVRAALAATGK